MQVGLLRVVLSLEERGPATSATVGAAVSPAGTPSKRRPPQHQQQPSPTSVAAAKADTTQGQDQAKQQQQQVLVQPAAAGDAGVAAGAQGFRQLPEYLVAWELEVWRKVRAATLQRRCTQDTLQRDPLTLSAAGVVGGRVRKSSSQQAGSP